MNKQDTYITDVVFRIDRYGVFAMFPHECSDHKGNVTTYQHIGQHSGANYKYCIGNSRKATDVESKDLLAELKSMGYNVKIVQRQNYDKFLKSYNEVKFG